MLKNLPLINYLAPLFSVLIPLLTEEIKVKLLAWGVVDSNRFLSVLPGLQPQKFVRNVECWASPQTSCFRSSQDGAQ